MKIIYRTILALSCFMFSTAANAQMNLDSGIIAYYPFDSSANDEGPHGLHGVVNGATLSADRFSRANKAYHFNGNGNTITVSGLCAKLGTEVTFAFWTKSTTQKDQSVFMATPDDPSNRLNLHYNYNHNGNNAIMFDYGSIYSGGRVDVIPFAQTSNWTHVTVVSSAAKDSMYIYADGLLIKQKSGHATFSSTTKTFSFGATAGFYYDGDIDEFRIYDRKLSRLEVIYLATANPLSVSEVKEKSDLVAYPNPSNGSFKLSNSAMISSVKIYNSTGILITELNNVNDSQVEINLETQQAGMYFAVVQGADNKNSVLKLIKSN